MKTLLWKYYFWVVLALDVVSFVVPMERRVWEMIEMGFFLIALIGLFGYCWQRQMLSRLFWQIFFVAFLCWITFYFCILPPLPLMAGQSKIPQTAVVALATATVIAHIPLIVGLYLYAFRRHDIWQGS